MRGFFILYKVKPVVYGYKMALTPEKKVKNKVVQILRQLGAYYFFPATYGMGRSGVPDVIVCYRGRFIGIECKAGKNQPTPLQRRELGAIETMGGISLVIREDNMDKLTDTLIGVRDE